MPATTEKQPTDDIAASFVPRVGRIVLYQLSPDDCTAAVKALQRGSGFDGSGQVNPYVDTGGVEPGLLLPAIITATWSAECVNLHVLLDSQGTLWVPSRVRGLAPGEWQVPE